MENDFYFLIVVSHGGIISSPLQISRHAAVVVVVFVN